MSIEKNLADALRPFADLLEYAYASGTTFELEINAADVTAAREALAAYDKAAAMSLPTDYRVTWEIDAFNATTPREAAEEARAAMTRAHTTATVFTVYGRDGSVTDVDLGEDEE